MANKTHLIIDAQLLQTRDRRRGMGLFLASLLDNISTSAGLSMTWIVNGRLPSLTAEDTKLARRLGASLMAVNLLHHADNAEFASSARVNRARLDAALASLIAANQAANIKTVYFMPALFSSEIHPTFPTRGTANSLLFYDLIPFLYHRNYFSDYEGLARRDYSQRFREFYKADTLITISQTTTDDLMMYLGVDPTRIVTILGAAADRSNLKPRAPDFSEDLAEGFVLMPSGDDLRKNNARAVQAFAGLGSKLKLVITSRFSAGTQRTLKALHPNLLFTGSVSDEEFLWLLDNTRAVFFPSEYEGLGMPLLEAVERNAIVACSNTPVFTEISQDAFFYFDPRSVSSMSETLHKALQTDPQRYRKRVTKEYQRILTKFAWPSTATAFIDAVRRSEPSRPRKKLAIFCPAPNSYSAVGKYALETHAELSRYFDIDYYAEGGLTVFDPTRPNILEYAAGYYPASSFTPDKAEHYDHVLYNLGNSEFHAYTILNALRLPANAIIHDTRMNGIFDWLERQGFITSTRRQLEAKLDERFGVEDTSCLVSLATNQRALFCHSAFAGKAIKHFILSPEPAVTQIAHPIGVPAIQVKRLNGPIVSFAGIIAESKGISIVRQVAENRQLQVRVFGFGVLGDSPLLQNLGGNVQILKDLSDKEFQDMLRRTSILVNYRSSYQGETSRSTLEAMRYGVVVIVKDIGWYSELPDDSVVKVRSEGEIMPAIEQLIKDPQQMQKIGKSARDFLERECSYKTYAEHLVRGLK